jgi:hypothetical protein
MFGRQIREQAKVEASDKPADFRTKAGAIQHFHYKPPNEDTRPKYGAVTRAFVGLIENTYDLIPDGPGKTHALRKLSEARMAINSAIANEGQ